MASSEEHHVDASPPPTQHSTAEPSILSKVEEKGTLLSQQEHHHPSDILFPVAIIRDHKPTKILRIITDVIFFVLVILIYIPFLAMSGYFLFNMSSDSSYLVMFILSLPFGVTCFISTALCIVGVIGMHLRNKPKREPIIRTHFVLSLFDIVGQIVSIMIFDIAIFSNSTFDRHSAWLYLLVIAPNLGFALRFVSVIMVGALVYRLAMEKNDIEVMQNEMRSYGEVVKAQDLEEELENPDQTLLASSERS